ncbi:MAG: hypothetical protein IPM56_01925 [Ignavibacteriales bacterium]|nr:MAG: hypothetical protein IPM56_01925 [Ignavibacteriales bacterium]
MQTQDKKVKRKRTLLQKSVNAFLYFWLGVLILLIIAFGISQTSTFREYLRELVIEEVNASLNGKLNIEKIDGTLFTSIILQNTSLVMESDTIFFAGKIEVRTSPLRIFLKTIYARKIEIANAKINLISDQNGVLNISKLVNPSEDEEKSKSEFPFNLEAADVSLKNIDFKMCSFNNRNSTAYYSELNMNDLRVKDLDLSLTAYANMRDDEYEIAINHIEMNPNITGFNLRNFSGRFAIIRDHIEIQNLTLNTNSSDVIISAELTGFNLFDSTAIKNLGNSDIKIKLQANPFSFGDLSSFVPATNILNGDLNCVVDVTGSVDELSINSLQTEFNKTRISLNGSLKNLSVPERMFILADFNNTEIYQPDLNILLPTLNLPVYEDYGVIKFDTLHFEGEPLNFKSNFALRTDKGSFAASTSLNLISKPEIYDLQFRSRDFDLSPIAGLNTILNTTGSVKGKGFDVNQIAAEVLIEGNGSSIEQNHLNIVSIEAAASEKKINYKLLLNSDSTQVDLTGLFDFTISDDAKYNLDGNLRHFNLAEILQDSSNQTDININLVAEGQGFNPDSMNLFVISTLYQSTIDDIPIGTTQAIVDIIRQDDGGDRIINIVSDLADITITGDFSVTETAELLTDEIGLITSVVREKYNSLIPAELQKENKSSDEDAGETIHYFEEHSESSTTLKYVIEFKDFTLLTLFLRDKDLELDGDISGEFTKTPEDLFFKLNTKLEYIKYWSDESVLFISGADVSFTIANNFTSTTFDDINTGLSVSIGRVYSGEDFSDIHLDLKIKNEVASIDFTSKMNDNFMAGIDGKIDLSTNAVKLRVDTLNLVYNDYKIKNIGELSVDYSGSSIRVNNFVIAPQQGSLDVSGYMNFEGAQDINLNIQELSANELFVDLLEMNPLGAPEAFLNLSASVKGDYLNPVIDIESAIDSIEFRDKKFGSLISNIDYQNKSLRLNSYFIDVLKQFGNAKLDITGTVPIDLSFKTESERISETAPITFKLLAKEFNLAAVGDLLPAVDKLNGLFDAEVDLSGTINNLKPSGFMTISNASFIAEANNLAYNADTRIVIDQDSIKIEHLIVENQRGVKDGGRMNGSGVIKLENLNIAGTELYMKGKLKVLGKESRSVSPSIYGDLAISTKGYIELRSDKNDTYLYAPLRVEVANLIFPPTQSAYTSGAENFIYRIKVDSSLIDSQKIDIESLIAEEERKDSRRITSDSSTGRFDYSINVEVEKEAKIVFVLSKELNQNLEALLDGNINYNMINGKSVVTGRLKLLDGSTLQFFKSFDATGTIRFDQDIGNPYLDISAAYRDYYSSSDSTASETEVAVKIKLSGPLRDLDKNFIQEKNNVAVYVGTDNIEDDIPDRTKSQTDAIMFILSGKFADEATAQDKSSAAGQLSGTATSIAGSLLGGVLNSYFGDYVRRVELRTVGAQTKFNLSGKVENFRYTIGGATDVFQDLSRANIKIEYQIPFFRNLLMRLERKEALADTYISNEMINELGLKYRFEF